MKNHLLAQIPELGAYIEGKEVTHDYHTEAMHLAKAAMLGRKELLDKKHCFNGTFYTDCLRSAVPHVLLALGKMILEGPSVMNKSKQDTMGVNAGVVLPQLLIF